MTITRASSLAFSTTDYEGMEARIGNTPLFRLRRITANLPSHVQVLVKAEWFNPSGSIKDRPAMQIIRMALLAGDLIPGKRLLDSTSGNMGIAYATLGAALGIPVTLCVPGNASPERIMILKALGAEVVLTDGAEGSDGAILQARALAKSDPNRYWYANQYDNPANWQAHYMTTGPEVLSQTNGDVTHLVAGLGTSGTIVGAGRYLHGKMDHVEIVGVEPDEPFHGLEGLKHMQTAIKPGIYDPSVADQIVEIRTEAAHEMVRRLAREEGLFVGISSGAAVLAALQVAAQVKEAHIVAILPDAGYKYLSDRELWESA